MKKKTLLSLLLLSLSVLGWGVFAHDCYLFTTGSIAELDKTSFNTTIKSIQDSSLAPILNVVSKEWVHRALLNLKSYCCDTALISKENKVTEGSCELDKNLIKDANHRPDSAFLFDHFLDVAMRRLEGSSGFIYPDVLLDEKAQEWREKIEEIANDTKGTLPLKINTLYTRFWGLQNAYRLPEFIGVDIVENRRELEKENNLRKILAAYDKWTLSTKYLNVCNAVTYLTVAFSPSPNALFLASLQKDCKNMVNDTQDREAKYVKNLSILKSNQLLNEAFEEYSDDYFSIRRGEALVDTLLKTISYLQGVYRQVPKIIPICN